GHGCMGVFVRIDPDEDFAAWCVVLQFGPPVTGCRDPALARADRTVTGSRLQAPIRSRTQRPAGAAREVERSMPGHEVKRKLGSDPPGSSGILTVVAVADAAHRRLDTGVGQAFGVFDRDVLAASVTMM